MVSLCHRNLPDPVSTRRELSVPAKKAAKKTAAKHADPKHHERKDLRRAYEHLGRVEILERSIHAEASKEVRVLVALAEKNLANGYRNDAADLLRAAEHFSFAALAGSVSPSSELSSELKDVVMEEVEHLTHKANEHWNGREESERRATIATIFHRALKAAAKALDAGAYRQALELSRGAEALAHVKMHRMKELESGTQHLRLHKP